VAHSFYNDIEDDEKRGWMELFDEYAIRMSGGGDEERRGVMQKSNPCLVPRNWMMFEAYKKAVDDDDFEGTRELYAILAKPYDYYDLSKRVEVDPRFFEPTPKEYRNVAGLSYLS